MPSLLPGYQYDIFISYRHNDNRSGWVTEFVKALHEELAATIKEPVTIYFDKNPHDGLLETHTVDKSLEGKLKCLIFIPILSQTYCDPKSFAWQHEFVAFNKMAIEGESIPLSSGEGLGVRSFGRDIKLATGNVASRILPIKIHDLDVEDKAILENEIGGVLRAIEFIFKSSGVNRPLTSKDDEVRSQGKILYRDQVNKVANAIKEIIYALKNPVSKPSRSTGNDQRSTTAPKSKTKFILAGAIVLLLIIAGYFLYPKIKSDHKPTEVIDKSIAVLPFIDLSEAKDQGWFSDGLTEEILNSLAHINELNVISRTSSFAFKNKNLRIQTIADSLGVNYIVEGSVRKSDTGLRITAQLIRAKDGFHIWSNTYDRNTTDIFTLQQDIATKVAQSLNISLDPKAIEQMQRAGTRNAEAFIAFLKGNELYEKGHNRMPEVMNYLVKANKFYEESSALDPNFANPHLFHADLFAHFLLREKDVAIENLTDDLAFVEMRQDLNALVAKSKSETERDYYRLYQIMNSDDWTSFRPLIERVLKNPDAKKYFAYQSFSLGTLLIYLGYGQEIQQIMEGILINDPLNRQAQTDLAKALIFSEKYEEALQRINQLDKSNPSSGIAICKLFVLYQLNLNADAKELMTQIEPDRASFSRFQDMRTLALLLNENKENTIIRKQIDEKKITNLYVFNVALGRSASNAKASDWDKKKILAFQLFDVFQLPGKKPPFDLSATPNFARRLKQAGPRGQTNK